MSSVPQITNLYCTKPLSAARHWIMHKAGQRGWLLVENLSTSDALRVHFNESGNDDANFQSVKPLHSKPFQVDEGDMVWFSSGVLGTHVRVENSIYKPTLDLYRRAEQMVENIPFAADAVAVTTTYNCTTLAKGYATYYQAGGNVAGFTGTLEVSSDNGVTYSSPIVMDMADPLHQAFEETRVVTHIRVTRAAGTFFIYYR